MTTQAKNQFAKHRFPLSRQLDTHDRIRYPELLNPLTRPAQAADSNKRRELKQEETRVAKSRFLRKIVLTSNHRRERIPLFQVGSAGH